MGGVMEHLVLTIPLLRKIAIEEPDAPHVNFDIEYLAKLLHQANKLGLDGITLESLVVKPNGDDGTTLSFNVRPRAP
jgi:hypothetical protein